MRGGYCDCFSVPATKKNDVHNSFLSPAVADGVFCAFENKLGGFSSLWTVKPLSCGMLGDQSLMITC